MQRIKSPLHPLSLNLARLVRDEFLKRHALGQKSTTLVLMHYFLA